MASVMEHIHPNGEVRAFRVQVHDHGSFLAVSTYVNDESPGTSSVSFFTHSREEVDTIMRGMAAAVREWFREPEPDYDAIAAEMAEDAYMESVRGI